MWKSTSSNTVRSLLESSEPNERLTFSLVRLLWRKSSEKPPMFIRCQANRDAFVLFGSKVSVRQTVKMSVRQQQTYCLSLVWTVCNKTLSVVCFFYFYFLHELRVLFLLSSNENIQIFKYTESGSNVWPIYGSLPLPVQHGCPFCGPSGCPHPGSGLNNKLCCNNYDLISFNVTELKSFQDGQIGNREGFEWELMKLDRLDIYLNNSLSLWCYSDVVITHLNVFKGSFITFLQVCGGKYETCQAVLL